MLFAQLAVAAYACPGMMQGAEPAASASIVMDAVDQADAAMPGCDQGNQTAPNLCAAHCEFGQQSAQHASAAILPALPGSFYVLPSLGAAEAGRPEVPPLREPAPAAASPPLAILNCCFRI